MAHRDERTEGGGTTHLLIVRPGALGDAVLTLPIITALLAAGASRIALLGNPSSWGFLAPGTPAFEVLDVDGRGWLGLFGADAALGPSARRALARTDSAAVFLGNRRAIVEQALRAAGVAHVYGAAPARRGEKTTDSISPDLPTHDYIAWPPASHHAAMRLFASFPELHLPSVARPINEDPLLRVTSEEAARATRTLRPATVPPGGLLALHPGSGGSDKCWPVECFAALADAAARRWGLAPVFLVGPADGPRWEALAALLPQEPAPLVLHNRPLREVLTLLTLARAYVGNDSGVTHLAARACPTLALFGPTDPLVWHPLGERVVILRAPKEDLAALSVAKALKALAMLL